MSGDDAAECKIEITKTMTSFFDFIVNALTGENALQATKCSVTREVLEMLNPDLPCDEFMKHLEVRLKKLQKSPFGANVRLLVRGKKVAQLVSNDSARSVLLVAENIHAALGCCECVCRIKTKTSNNCSLVVVSPGFTVMYEEPLEELAAVAVCFTKSK